MAWICAKLIKKKKMEPGKDGGLSCQQTERQGKHVSGCAATGCRVGFTLMLPCTLPGQNLGLSSMLTIFAVTWVHRG